MSDYLGFMIATVPGVVALLGTLALAWVSVKNTQVTASDEIASAASELVASYRIEVESFRKEVSDLKREIGEWESKYNQLDSKWEMKYNKLYSDHIRVIELNEELTDRVRYLEVRLGTGPKKE